MTSTLTSSSTAFCAALPLTRNVSTAFTSTHTLNGSTVPRYIAPSRRTSARIVAQFDADSVRDPNSLIHIDAPSSDTLFIEQGFGSLGLLGELVEALDSMSITHPTTIQSRGIPPALNGIHVILGAATGSGKTFAYLLPVVQQLKVAELLRTHGDAPLRVAHRPRAVVIVPTRELASQVGSVAKTLAHYAKFRVVSIDGAGSWRNAKDALARPIDVLVTTTGRLLQLMEARVVDLRFAAHIVIDEVDTMFDAGFAPELRRILVAARRRPEDIKPPQCIAAGATHPRAAEALYQDALPGAVRINASLHRAPAGLTQRFVDVHADGKLAELDALLGEARRDGALRGGRIIVFCNTIASARFVEHYVRERGHTASCMHAAIPSIRRADEYAAFRRGDTQLLVCSDCAARGLDNLAVDHVVLFDFPSSAVDYIHRAGRTSRAGAKGTVTSLVTKKDVRLARAIQKAALEQADALESARVAREQELFRKSEDERRKKEEERFAKQAAFDSAKGREELFEQAKSSSSSSRNSSGRGRQGFRGGKLSTRSGASRTRRSGGRGRFTGNRSR